MAHELKQVMGLPAGIASAVGLVVASTTLVVQGQGFGIAGPGFLIPMVMAMLVNLFSAFSFAELSGILPRAGSINHYTQAALGPFPAIVAVLGGYITTAIFGGSAEILVPGIIVHDIFWNWMPPRAFSLALVILLVAINLRGITWFSTIQIATAGAMILSITAVGLIGLFGLGSGTPVASSTDPFNPLGWSVLSLLALAFWLFGGAEFVTTLAEEIRRPKLYVPLSMFFGLLIVLVSGVLYGLASLHYVSTQSLAASTTPQIDTATAMMGRTGQIWMSLASILAAATTVNTLLCALPRMLYGMALQGQLPAIFGKVNRFQVPSVATFFMACAMLAPLAFGAATADSLITYILASTFTYVTAYIIAHVDLMVLRRRYPSAPGGFRTPLYPLPQLLSLAGLVWMLFKISPDPALTPAIYTIAVLFLTIATVYAALWVRLKEKKGLFQTTPLADLVEDFNEDEPPANKTLAEAAAD